MTRDALRPVICLTGGFRLDLSRGCLLGPDDAEIPLRRKSFEVLRYLATNAGRLISRGELLEAVWPGLYVNDDGATQCVAEVRRALGEGGRRNLRTVPGRGYILEAEPTAGALPPSAGDAILRSTPRQDTPAPSLASLELPSRPSLAVLPFDNIGGDPNQAYFADGLVEELIAALSRIRALFVIARNSSFVYRGRPVDVREAGRDLGVRYVIEGSVRRAGARVRIAAQLVDATAGGQHIWAERFEGTLDDIFGLQDRVTEAIAGAIEPSLRGVEVDRARRKPTDRLDAYDLYLRALPEYYAMTRTGSDAALVLLRRAIAADPAYSLAKAFAARTHLTRAAQGWSGQADRAEGVLLAREALDEHRDDPATLRLAGHALVYLAYDHDRSYAALERALTLNPNSAEVLGSAGWLRIYAGEPEAAIPLLERAMRLSPLDPEMSHFLGGLAYAHLMLDRPEQALANARASMHQKPRWPTSHRALITALWRLGRDEEARQAALRHREETPDAYRVFAERNVALFPGQPLADMMIQALRNAGVPE
jgi:TolB-like protein/Tfp pilus assembly protein PilF